MAAHPRIVRLAPDVVLNATTDEALLLKLGDETAFTLNTTAARVAGLIVEGLPVGAIIDRLSTEYQCEPAEVAVDVHRLVTALLARGLVIDPEQA